METFSALLVICAGNSPATGEFTAQRSVTRSFNVSFDLRLNVRLSKQPWGWWFGTPPCSLGRHCNATIYQAAPSYRSCNEEWIQIFQIWPFDKKLDRKQIYLEESSDGKICIPCRLKSSSFARYQTLSLLFFVYGVYINTLRPIQNGRHFADDTCKRIFLNESVWFLIKISLKCVP